MHSCLILARKLEILLRAKEIPLYIKEAGKLVYAAHGYSLVTNRRPLYLEPNEVWKHGPSPGLLMRVWEDDKFSLVKDEDADFISPEDERALIWTLKLMDYPSSLDQVTMGPGSPWLYMWTNRKGPIISDVDTRIHFTYMV